MAENKTTSVELLLRLDERSEATRGRRLQGALRDAVRSGRLVADARLPSTRALADDLGLSRGVVVEAYDQLVAEGYLVAARGSGTRVAAGVAESAGPPPTAKPATPWLVDFDPGRPDLAGFPHSMWFGALRAGTRELSATELDYGDPQGLLWLRRELAAYLARVRGAEVAPERVSIVGGFTQGLGLLSRVLVAGGGRQLTVEDPGAYVQRRAVEAAGLIAHPLPVDDEGARIDLLDSSCREPVLLTPAHQYPMGAVLSAQRRSALISWLRVHPDRLVIEDDYDAEFRYDRQPIGCLQGLVPDQVLLGGSVSKALAPGMRLGWLVLPSELVGAVVEAQSVEALQPPVTSQAALAHLLASGAYDRHVRRSRARYRKRRDVLVDALGSIDGVGIHGVAAGLHLVLTLPPDLDEVAVAAAAAERGVYVRPLRDYRIVGGAPGLTLGYAHLTETTIAEGGRIVADLL